MGIAGKVMLALMVAVIIAFCYLAYGGIRRSFQRESWCTEHHMESTGGGHSPVLCYDEKTRLLYKPR